MRGRTCYSRGPLKGASHVLLSPMPIHYCCWFADSGLHLDHVGERPGPPSCPRSHLLLKMNFHVGPSPCSTRPWCWSSSQMYKMLSVMPYFFIHCTVLVVFTLVASCLKLFIHLVVASSIVKKSQWRKETSRVSHTSGRLVWAWLLMQPAYWPPSATAAGRVLVFILININRTEIPYRRDCYL